MAKATWSGTVSFGMVQIPAKMYTATDAEKKIEFNQLNSKTGNRIKVKRVDEKTGDEVPFKEIIKGYEIAKDEYVQITDEELDRIAPDKTSKIEIVGFVDPATIDPLYLDKPYYLGAGDNVNKPYSLLKKALQVTGKVAIAKFTMRTKEYVCMIRPIADGLTVSTLRYPDEIRDPKTVKSPDLPLTDKEIEIATTLVETFDDVRLTDFTDEYRERVRSVIKAKASGKEIPEGPKPEEPETTDLLAALQASVAVAQQRRKAS